MKRFSSIFAVLAILSWSAAALAHEGHHLAGEKTITKTISGEVVDMGCWLGHAARGKEHISCATKCLSQGMPIGLLTSNGTLYLVTLDHDNADPYVSLKDMAGKDVSITGELLSRSGMKAIEASKVELASK
jgi:hypothetical protein